MASILNVDQINNAAGTSAVTIDGSGNVQIPGHVVQVVQATSTSVVSTTSTSFVATGFSASITPTSSSNKILVMGSLPIFLQNISSGAHGVITVYRGGFASGTDISSSPTAFGLAQVYSAGSSVISMAAFHTIDSPATTSSVTYEVALRAVGTVTPNIAVNQDQYSLTLMEIAQ